MYIKSRLCGLVFRCRRWLHEVQGLAIEILSWLSISWPSITLWDYISSANVLLRCTTSQSWRYKRLKSPDLLTDISMPSLNTWGRRLKLFIEVALKMRKRSNIRFLKIHPIEWSIVQMFWYWHVNLPSDEEVRVS